ncbi:MAG: FliO/MopB family protein [Thermodesulfobacteriota bacterium]
MRPLLLMIICMVPSPLWASPGEPVNMFAAGMKLLVGLAFVIGLMLLFHVLNRKGFLFLQGRSGGRIQIVETRPVGGRKSLCLVEVRGEQILLGIGNDRIDCLHHFGPRFEEELQAQVETEK